MKPKRDVKNDTLPVKTKQPIKHLPPRLHGIIQRFVKDTRRILKDNIIAEYLFGSYATNSYGDHSDIDILIIVNTYSTRIRQQMSGLASDYSLEYDIYISPIIKEYRVWNQNKHYGTLFYQEVNRDGIPLI